MTRKTSKFHRNGKPRVKAIHSSEPSARDEGPRLIPLRVEAEDVPMSHYLQLADKALGTAAARAPIKKTALENGRDVKEDEDTGESAGPDDV